jgi:hypothetical protein
VQYCRRESAKIHISWPALVGQLTDQPNHATSFVERSTFNPKKAVHAEISRLGVFADDDKDCPCDRNIVRSPYKEKLAKKYVN